MRTPGPTRAWTVSNAARPSCEDLEERGYLVKTEPYTHSIGHCQRCQTMVEPLVSKQWFVRMEPLAATGHRGGDQDGRIQIIPDRFTKVYLNWMENIRDWCISRQLWWGHRIPVWYCEDCEGHDGRRWPIPTVCQHCGSRRIEQDPDVLDTWFSSGLWPHSTLGWPDDTETCATSTPPPSWRRATTSSSSG